MMGPRRRTLSAVTRIACRQMTPQHLDALHASGGQACCLPARHHWQRKATAHAELFTMLGDLTGDRDLARLVSAAAARLAGPRHDGRPGGRRHHPERHLAGCCASREPGTPTARPGRWSATSQACTTWGAWPAKPAPAALAGPASDTRRGAREFPRDPPGHPVRARPGGSGHLARVASVSGPRRARPDRPAGTSRRSPPPTGSPRWGRRRRQGAPRSPPVPP
jgi:hypothetical protein